MASRPVILELLEHVSGLEATFVWQDGVRPSGLGHQHGEWVELRARTVPVVLIVMRERTEYFAEFRLLGESWELRDVLAILGVCNPIPQEGSLPALAASIGLVMPLLDQTFGPASIRASAEALRAERARHCGG